MSDASLDDLYVCYCRRTCTCCTAVSRDIVKSPMIQSYLTISPSLEAPISNVHRGRRAMDKGNCKEQQRKNRMDHISVG